MLLGLQCDHCVQPVVTRILVSKRLSLAIDIRNRENVIEKGFILFLHDSIPQTYEKPAKKVLGLQFFTNIPFV